MKRTSEITFEPVMEALLGGETGERVPKFLVARKSKCSRTKKNR